MYGLKVLAQNECLFVYLILHFCGNRGCVYLSLPTCSMYDVQSKCFKRMCCVVCSVYVI